MNSDLLECKTKAKDMTLSETHLENFLGEKKGYMKVMEELPA